MVNHHHLKAIKYISPTTMPVHQLRQQPASCKPDEDTNSRKNDDNHGHFEHYRMGVVVSP
jgi:hypothetical protein